MITLLIAYNCIEIYLLLVGHSFILYSFFLSPQSGVLDVYVCVHYLHYDCLPLYAHLVSYAHMFILLISILELLLPCLHTGKYKQ
jgi:hypothetical protein